VTLVEAVDAVRENGGRIRRKIWHGVAVQVDGANLRDPKLYVFRRDTLRGLAVAARWKPNVYDLLADDWMVTSGQATGAIGDLVEGAP
jgi:hypothetical protein